MKRLEVWEKENESITDDELPKDRILLRLKEDGYGSISLIAVSPSGKRIRDGSLLKISNEGITLWSGVNLNIGLTLDDENRLERLEE